MQKDKVQIFCCSFDNKFSSCGTRKPNLFSWTNEKQNKIVYVDQYILHGLNNNKNKFGWLAESPSMLSDVYDHIFNNFKKYKDSYIKIFTCDEKLIEKDYELFEFSLAGSNLPWTPPEEFGIHKKSKLASFLCSEKTITEGHRTRIKIAESFKGLVDFYGGVFNSKKIGASQGEHYHHKRKTEAMNDYMFTMAVENSKTDTYFTEKITDCFANGTIPIYYGTKKIEKYFDINGVIFLDENFKFEDLSADLYYSKKEYIEKNLENVKQMESADDIIYKKITSYF